MMERKGVMGWVLNSVAATKKPLGRRWSYSAAASSSSSRLIAFVLVVVTSCALLSSSTVAGVELTFELPDNAKECFHENIQKDKSSTFEFQVRVNERDSVLGFILTNCFCGSLGGDGRALRRGR
jgi:hypothetical protein